MGLSHVFAAFPRRSPRTHKASAGNGLADVVIAVHDLRRNIVRAVRSVLADPDCAVRVLLVAHNVARADVERAIAGVITDFPDRVRIVELHDAIPSPSGPFNYGLAQSDAEYVGIMGSDDELDAGAVSQWRETLARTNADAVIARIVRGKQRTVVPSPPRRPLRRGRLDFARDRLSYRSAPLGLMRREVIQRCGLHLHDGARTGGDLPFVTSLWLHADVVAGRGALAYVEHDDAPVRVTQSTAPVAEELAPMRATLSNADVRSMGRQDRDALVVKLYRRNVVDTVRKRSGGLTLSDADLDEFRSLFVELDALSPRARKLISRAHARLVDEIATPAADRTRIAHADSAARTTLAWDALRPASWRYALHPQAQPRFVVASGWVVLSYRLGRALRSRTRR